jgi:hypothetical protein
MPKEVSLDTFVIFLRLAALLHRIEYLTSVIFESVAVSYLNTVQLPTVHSKLGQSGRCIFKQL